MTEFFIYSFVAISLVLFLVLGRKPARSSGLVSSIQLIQLTRKSRRK